MLKSKKSSLRPHQPAGWPIGIAVSLI